MASGSDLVERRKGDVERGQKGGSVRKSCKAHERQGLLTRFSFFRSSPLSWLGKRSLVDFSALSPYHFADISFKHMRKEDHSRQTPSVQRIWETSFQRRASLRLPLLDAMAPTSALPPTQPNPNLLRFTGHNYLRQRLVLSLISGKSIRIDSIRSDDAEPGLRGRLDPSLRRRPHKECTDEFNFG
jgi:hypothetical protein